MVAVPGETGVGGAPGPALNCATPVPLVGVHAHAVPRRAGTRRRRGADPEPFRRLPLEERQPPV